MNSRPEKLENEQLCQILEWDAEYINSYLVGVYAHKKSEIKKFMNDCKKELKNRGLNQYGETL